MSEKVLDKESIRKYIKKNFPNFYDDNLKVQEIGDGNINYVFIVHNNKGESLVLKQADELLRSSGRPLDTHRIEIEKEYLLRSGKLSPKYVPEIYKFDLENSIIAMEDISEFKNLRKELERGFIPKDFYKWLIDFLVPILGDTSSIIENRHEKKENIKFFTNPEMCDISEDLVLTEPYEDYKNRNIIYPGEETFIKENIYEDEEFRLAVDILKEKFMNYNQCLIHGDLHSGSIFVNENGLKVIDSEFAFYGPGGYDIGNVLAHFIIAFITGLYDSNKLEFLDELENQVEKIFDEIFKELYRYLLPKLDINHYSKKFLEEFIKGIKSDTLGYTGTEIIRRVVGDTKTSEIESLEGEDRIHRDKRLLCIGKKLILERKSILKGYEIIDLMEENLELE